MTAADSTPDILTRYQTQAQTKTPPIPPNGWRGNVPEVEM